MDLQKTSLILFLYASILFPCHFTIADKLLIKDPLSGHAGTDDDDEFQLQNYIVQVRHSEAVSLSVTKGRDNLYSSLLATLADGANAPASRLIHSYSDIFSGFSARLTKQEVDAMSKQGWFVQAFEDRIYELHTTHTPEFLGLRQPQGGTWNTSNMGEGIIIGVVDTGVTPGHPSFDDDGMPPPPAKWKGICDFNGSLCNNKIIGARSFIDSIKSAKPIVDEDGHGTHTASTAAGAFVNGASMNGTARGQAAGMAPRAHLAIYKACAEAGCAGSDVLAAMDAAVRDGVDVLSLSLGQAFVSFGSDLNSMGAFGAMLKGVFVSFSGGNSGPYPSSLANDAPWVLTVAASTTDRRFPAIVKLGDGQEFDGESLHQPDDFEPKMRPLVYAGAIDKPNASYCMDGTFDGFDIRGKIVLCYDGIISTTTKGEIVRGAGGAGMIIQNDMIRGYSLDPDWHALPASLVAYADGAKIKAYIKSTENPTATIVFKGTATSTPQPPAIAAFSSRGPAGQSPGILKPDITGPGVSILAAWNAPVVGPPSAAANPAGANYNIVSGTSMSCPHLSGVAALIKKAHPDWSPAAIKSAMMTTAYVVDRNGMPIVDEEHLPADYYAMGAGHVDPSRAIDPGLVYDISPNDYINYFCGLGYPSDYVSIYVRKELSSCENNITEGELNYPSISAFLGPTQRSIKLMRTVTNVGDAKSTYWAEVDMPKGVSVYLKPTRLWFKKVNQKKRFRIIFRMNGTGEGKAQGQLKWVSEKHVVRSPLLITFK